MARDIAFKGYPIDDPHKYIRSFIEMCGTLKKNEVFNDEIKLRLFLSLHRTVPKIGWRPSFLKALPYGMS